MTTLNLRLPPSEPVDADDFLDMARFAQLQSALERCASECAEQEERLSQLPEADLTEPQLALRGLLRERAQLVAQPLPRIIQRIEGNGGGAMLGRMVGEIADIGLFFVNPAFVGVKTAALIGKTAKVAGIAANTARIATTVAKTVEVAKVVSKGGKVAGLVPPPVADKLKILEGLSLGYWGERLGASLGGGPRDEEIIDPEAQAQQQAALAEMDAHGQTLRAQLARCEDIASERQLTGWALEQNRKEQTHVQSRLADLTRRAEEHRRAYEHAAREERQRALQRQVERACAQWRRSFEQQTAHMSDLLRVRARDDWETRIATLIGERLAEVETMNARIDAAPAEREATLERLRAEANGLKTALTALN